MKTLVVISHPLENSLCKYLAKNTIEYLESKGYEITVKDLYQENFYPALLKEERESYYGESFDKTKVEEEIKELQSAESIVLVFPTWWFSVPAILKGWFDRVWAPGFAYEHDKELGAIRPKLENLKEMKVVTTLGASWFVDTFILRKPVEKVLKYALLGACSKGASFQMLSLYNAEKAGEKEVEKFVAKIKTSF